MSNSKLIAMLVAVFLIGLFVVTNFAKKSDQAGETREDESVAVSFSDAPMDDKSQVERAEEPVSESGVTTIQLVYELDAADIVERQQGWDAGHAEVSSVDPQRILRWRPIRVDPTIFVPTENYGGVESLETLMLPFFPDGEIIAKRIRFQSDPGASMYSWSGTVETESGEIGNISIHVARDQDSGDLKVVVNYNDRLRDLHIIPTDDSPYYVAVETYRGYHTKID